MKRVSRLALLAILLVCSTALPSALAQTPTSDGSISPALEAELEQLDAGEMIGVIVTLKDQVDLKALPRAGRSSRLRTLVSTLKGKSAATRGPITRFLASRKARGEVASVRPLWIFNGLAVTATADVVRDLAARGDVLRVAADEVVTAPAPSLASAAAGAQHRACRRPCALGPRLPWAGDRRREHGHGGRSEPPGSRVAMARRDEQLVRPERPASHDTHGQERARHSDHGRDGRRRRRRDLHRRCPGRAMDRRQDLQRPGLRDDGAHTPGVPVAARPGRKPEHARRTERRQQFLDAGKHRLQPRVPARSPESSRRRDRARLRRRQLRLRRVHEREPGEQPRGIRGRCGLQRRPHLVGEQSRPLGLR